MMRENLSLKKQSVREARALLSASRNRLHIVGAILVYAAFCGVWTLLMLMWLTLADNLRMPVLGDMTVGAWLAIGCLILFWIFIGLPLWYGVKQYAIRRCLGEDLSVGALFEPLMYGAAYKKALRVSFRWLWKCLAVGGWIGLGIFILVRTVKYLLGIGLAPAVLIVISAVGACVIAALAMLLILRMQGSFCVPTYLQGHPDVSVSEATTVSQAAVHRHVKEIWAYRLLFLGYDVLAVFTIGIVWFLDVIPLYLASQHIYAELLLKENENRKQVQLMSNEEVQTLGGNNGEQN